MDVDYAERARGLLGTRFRPQGRGESGLDCVGLVLATFDIPADKVRRNYSLRGDYRAEIERALETFFQRVDAGRERPGDVMLLQVAADQLHLAVRTGAGFVHAHAGIGRVVGYSPSRGEGVAALRSSAVSEVADSPARAVRGAELVVLAVPPGPTLELIGRMGPSLAPGAILTDVCSVKAPVMARTLRTRPPPNRRTMSIWCAAWLKITPPPCAVTSSSGRRGR